MITNIEKFNHSGKLTKAEIFSINRMSVKDILSIDPNLANTFSTPLMQALVRKASRIANRNISDAERLNITSPGLYAGIERKKNLGRGYSAELINKKTNRVDLNALKKEYKALTTFLDNDTRTISGAKKFNKELIKRLAIETYGSKNKAKNKQAYQEKVNRFKDSMSKENLENYWRVYDRYKELSNGYFGSLGSAKVQAIVARACVNQNFDVEDATSLVVKLSQVIYEKENNLSSNSTPPGFN